MDFSGLRRRTIKATADTLSDLYPIDLQMYDKPPKNTLLLEEFEDLALDRLQLLRIFEQASLKGHKPFSEDWKNCIKQDLKKENLKRYSRLLGFTGTSDNPDYQARRADHISHFILRLAYCRSEELRRWFLTHEVELFKLRFMNLSKQGVAKFLELNKLDYYKPMPDEEKDKIRSELIESTIGLSSALIGTTDFYKIHFTEVCSLLKNRRAYLHKGFVYVPSSEFVVCISTLFRARLSEALAHTNQCLPALDDDRISTLLNNIHTMYTHDYGYTEGDKDAVNIAQLDMYSRKHYPLCMRYLHEVLRANHHLKHRGRLQYGFFLKALGVTYEDAMKFWREEFTRKIDESQFDKQYSYNVKHAYGKVGRMQSYSAYSCMKIITDTVGPGEHHGCPFKHWDPVLLKKKMSDYGAPSEGINEVLELANKGHFQIACTKYYEITHGQPSSSVINHPNQYAEESLKLSKGDSNSNATNVNVSVRSQN